MKTKPEIVWHYTTGVKFKQIMESNVLLRDDQTTPQVFAEGERGFVWFSSEPFWEPTATKGILDKETGERRDATIDEMISLCDGLIRIGLKPGNGILPFGSIRSFRGPMRKALERRGREMGADPRRWYVSSEPISPLSEKWEAVEIYGKDRQWVSILEG